MGIERGWGRKKGECRDHQDDLHALFLERERHAVSFGHSLSPPNRTHGIPVCIRPERFRCLEGLGLRSPTVGNAEHVRTRKNRHNSCNSSIGHLNAKQQLILWGLHNSW